MSVSSANAAPFVVESVPAEIRVLGAEVLVQQRTAQMMAENAAAQKAALASPPPAEGTGALIDRLA
jgi:ferric-dicitrate binding protein FerR (iron transport regulator)